jgi:hypothetical protein
VQKAVESAAADDVHAAPGAPRPALLLSAHGDHAAAERAARDALALAEATDFHAQAGAHETLAVVLAAAGHADAAAASFERAAEPSAGRATSSASGGSASSSQSRRCLELELLADLGLLPISSCVSAFVLSENDQAGARRWDRRSDVAVRQVGASPAARRAWFRVCEAP